MQLLLGSRPVSGQPTLRCCWCLTLHPSITRRLTDEEKIALQAIGNAAGSSSLVANLREKQKESFARPLVRPVPAAGVAHVAGGRVPRVRA